MSHKPFFTVFQLIVKEFVYSSMKIYYLGGKANKKNSYLAPTLSHTLSDALHKKSNRHKEITLTPITITTFDRLHRWPVREAALFLAGAHQNHPEKNAGCLCL